MILSLLQEKYKNFYSSKSALAAIAIIASLLLSIGLSSGIAKALPCPDGFDGGSVQQIERGSCANHQTGSSEADDIEASAGASGEPTYKANDCNDPDGLDQENCGIIKYLVIFINLLAGLAGIVIIGSMIVAGIQYSSAGSNPQQISAAKDRIRNAIIALLFFLFGYALLNYLVPGGVL